LSPLANVTLMVPASATRPEALTVELETWPLLIPIETVWPSPHSDLEEAIRTLQVPSKEADASAAGAANGEARANAMLIASEALLKRPIDGPFPCLDTAIVAARGLQRCDGCHIAHHM